MLTKTLTVGVIASTDELGAAMRMRRLPDAFELRLDRLPNVYDSQLANLRRPLVLTARHQSEGGEELKINRRDLLLSFLRRASWVDVELRSLHELREVWQEAHQLKISRICSWHDFGHTPDISVLSEKLNRAQKNGADIFKVVTRADTVTDLLNLMHLLESTKACCVMATGRFGPMSRLLFPLCGSRLVYAPLRRALYDGQLTLEQLRRLRDFYAKM